MHVLNWVRRHPWPVVVVVGLAVFGLLALALTTPLTPFLRLDASLAETCYDYTANHPTVGDVFTVITDTGAGRPLWIIGIASVVALVVRREWVVALLWAIGQYTVREVPGLLKDQFNRPRPPFIEYPGTSFPSGHALGSAAIYGMLAYLVLRFWAGSRWRYAIAGCLYGYIALICLSRMLLSAHYLSDVTAGAAVGLAWAAAWATLADALAPKK